MSQDNPQATPASQVDLLAVDALFRRIAERGRKIRIQAKENFASAQNTAHRTGQTVDGETKMTKAQGGK
jgi:3-hydroxymyristoyl/3-hydroxydecanoyl-(acyl carrier protein) dehydratase